MTQNGELAAAAASVGAAMTRYMQLVSCQTLEAAGVTMHADFLPLLASRHVRLPEHSHISPQRLARCIVPASAITPAFVAPKAELYDVFIKSDTTLEMDGKVYNLAGRDSRGASMRIFCMNSLLLTRHMAGWPLMRRLRECGVDDVGFANVRQGAQLQFGPTADRLPFVERDRYVLDPCARFIDTRPRVDVDISIPEQI